MEEDNIPIPEDNTPTNAVDERLRLERIIKNDISNPRLKEGLLKRYLDYDEFVKGLPADRAEQLLDYTNQDVAFNLDLFKDEFNTQPPYTWPLSEDLESIFFDWEEPSPIEDAVLADIENWDLDAEGNPIDPRKKPEGMSKFQQQLSAQYDYLVTSDTPTNVVDYQDTGIGGRPFEIEGGVPVDKSGNPIKSIGNADETITIYRVVPEGVDSVNANDWVFINKGQAEEALKNANANVDGNFNLIEMEVSRADVYPSTRGNLEMGYFPKDTPTNVKNVKNLTDQQLYDEFVKYSKITLEAEKFGDLTPELLNIQQTQDWETFSRARGYTEQEISDFKRYLDLSAEMENRFPGKDGFASLAEGINYELQHEDSITTLEEWKKFTSTDTPTNVVDDVTDFQNTLRNKYSNVIADIEIGGVKQPTLSLEPIPGQNSFVVKNLYIDDTLQGQGYGTQIMNDIIEFADNNNLQVELDISATNKSLAKYYERFGFVLSDETDRDMVRKPNTPTNVVGAVDELPSLETRFKIETIDPDDFAVPGDKYDLVTGWEDDVITPNKVFNPDQFTIINEQGLPVFTQQGNEIYQRILSGTATDEDITKFFIYLVTHSPAPAYTFSPFHRVDALADIIKIGIFSDRPLNKIIPLGSGLLEKQFFDKLLSRNKNIKSEQIVPLILDIVQENGQFENIRDKMRNVLLNAHNEIYSKNPNDYFVLWRGGDLNRTFPWQSMTKRMEAAQDVASQMNGMYGAGIETSSYVLHKYNFIDLDALGLSYMNEQEIIVFTKAALAKGAKRPTPVNNPGKAKDISEWWLIAKESKDMFPKNGVNMTNISQYVDDSGQATQEFFSTVINGIDPKYRPSQQYEPIIEITNEKLLTFQKEYNNAVVNGGNFNQHIFTSIPTFYEAQIIKGQALINLLNNAYPNRIFSFEQGLRDGLYDFNLLDIGGTEGTWSSTIAALEPRIQVTVLDPNRDAERIFNKNTLVNKQFQLGAFSHNKEDFGKYFDETGVMFIKPNRQYDIVHESMAFQFIDADRTGQIEFIKNEVLKEDGILFIEEKFLDNDTIYQANENLKNEFKLQYYTEEQLSNKKFNVLLNMEGKQAAISDVEAALNNNFKYVVQYWDSGNFKGFVASNNEKVLGFVDEINALNTSLTNHRFSTAPTDKEIKGSIQNISNKTNTSKEIAKDIITNTVAENPTFFNNIQNILGDIGNKIKKFSLSATSIGLTGLAKVTPVLAPGDVIIEKTLEKVIPYLDEASAKLGFARLPWNKILPTYIATEIGIAMADTVQAAMYAYEEAAKNKQPTKLEEVLTKAFLPKSYEEEALEKMNRRASHMNDLFFNTPTGKEVVKSMDFGSAFLRELDKEKISKYSPGWSLTKSIFTMLGTAYQNTKNPSDYSTKLKDNPAMIYNAGFTGSTNR